LPVLEAMGAGLPVIASDLPVVREITAGTARLVPPGDAEAWRRALEDLVTAAGRRDGATAQARRLAAEFTWDRTAALTAAAYRQVLGCE
jgi:glycosyltransferase involved in cell wall biosynthesis